MAEVYWIRHKEHTDILKEGYVGVSKNAAARWKLHAWALRTSRHENPFLVNVVNKHGWNSLIKEVVVIADEAYCYDLENKLRPVEQTGWNIAIGGSKPPKSKPRGEDYISPLKGKKTRNSLDVGSSALKQRCSFDTGARSQTGCVPHREKANPRTGCETS